ncbi:hypothetical protein P2318_25255 [Myxococcaceae bacterium GXIMD 01537]
MSLEARLDALHARVATRAGFRLLTAVTRGLLAVGFFKAGAVKVLGLPFTSMSVETPIGHFFDAMHRTGGYYRFLGLGQVAAALLLLLPRTATLGALFYFPIILNIFVITVTLGFRGTPVITGMMLLACLYLLCWDYPRLKGVLFDATPASAPLTRPPVAGWLTLTVALGCQGAMGVLGDFSSGHVRPGHAAMLALALGIPLAKALRHRASAGAATRL